MGQGEGKGERGRGLSCGAKCTKILIIPFNIIFLLIGLAAIGAVSYVLADPSLRDYLKVVEQNENNDFIIAAMIVMIMVGVFACATAIMGICGACRNSRCLLILFEVFLVCIILAELGAGAMAILYRTSLSTEVQYEMRQQANHEVTDDPNDDTITMIWYRMQHDFSCCGGKGAIDYEGSVFVNKTNGVFKVPPTCCVLSNSDPVNPVPRDIEACNNQAPSGGTELHAGGCYDAITDWLSSHSGMVIGIAVGVIAVECLIFFLGILLIKDIRRMKKV